MERKRVKGEGWIAKSRRSKVEGRTSKGERQRSKVKGRRSGDDELFGRAIESFERNLARLRRYADVRTICMHGSPLSKWDSRLLWERFDYRDYGIVGEPYFDMDFGRVAYYMDTGRRWDGEKMSVRDKPMGVTGTGSKEMGEGRPGTGDRKPETGSRRRESGSRTPVSGLRSPLFLFFIRRLI